MTESLADHEFAQAIANIGRDDMSSGEKIDMLVDIATRLQRKPKSARDLEHAVSLYDAAVGLCAPAEAILAARIRLRKASALFAHPEPGPRLLYDARSELESVLPCLSENGSAEEVAEAEMNLGVVLQALAGIGCGSITDAIMAYQRAVRVFTREQHPTEFAVLHNNLAAAYLSIPLTDRRAKMREALAVQSFTEALKVVTLETNPSEYAMLQNNLGNALQYAASGHPLANNLRALEAYDAALRVRTAKDTPAEYANTIANKANCLRNLPDDPENPSSGNINMLQQSRDLYREAIDVFESLGAVDKVAIVREALAEVVKELQHGERPGAAPLDFGVSRA